MINIFSQIKNFKNDIDFVEGQPFEFVLSPDVKTFKRNMMEIGEWYQITVRPYMTMKATSSWDFMKRYNNDIPMPCTTMSGKVIRANRSMVYMQLHDNISRTTWEGWIVKRAITSFKEIQNG